MTAFETIVRPVVFPDIRPAPAQPLPAADDPAKGVCTIKGNPAKEVNFSNSRNMSMSRSVSVETERTFDSARVYQLNDDGTINRDNFVDIEVARRIKSRGGAKPDITGSAPTGEPDPGTLAAARKRNEDIDNWYARQVDQMNIEIRQRDQVRRNQDGSGG